jgi:hypothetical protein
LGLATAPGRRRIAFGGGLIGLQRGPDSPTWRLFLFDFSPKTDKRPPSVASP